MNCNIVVIGTGVTGTAVIVELLERFKQCRENGEKIENISITTISDKNKNGPGYAYEYEGADPRNVINQMAKNMSARAVDKNGEPIKANEEFATWESYDFFHWLQSNREKIIRSNPEAIIIAHPGIEVEKWQPDPDAYYSRGLYGQYLECVFEESVNELRALGITVEPLNNTQAINGRRFGNKMQVEFENLKSGGAGTIIANKLLLATGRWKDKAPSAFRDDIYFNRPFPAKAILEKIKPSKPFSNGAKKRIIVQGMGLSGIDSLISLATGEFYRNDDGKLCYIPGENHPEIIAVSRSGFFSIVKDKTIEYPPLKCFDQKNLDEIKRANGGFLTLPALKSLIEDELEAQTGEHIDLLDYVHPKISAREKLEEDIQKAKNGNKIYGIFQQILSFQPFSQLAPEDKEFFLKYIRTQFLQNIAAMPTLNAEKILALMDSGAIKIVKLGYDAPTCIRDGDKMRIDYTDEQGSRCSLYSDYMIAASGDNLNITKNEDPLIQALLRNREILPNREAYADPERAMDMLYTQEQVAAIKSAGAVQTANNGGIRVDFNNFAVIRNDSSGKQACSDTVYALGMPVMNWGTERDFASSSTKAAKTLVNHWMEEWREQGLIKKAEGFVRRYDGSKDSKLGTRNVH